MSGRDFLPHLARDIRAFVCLLHTLAVRRPIQPAKNVADAMPDLVGAQMDPTLPSDLAVFLRRKKVGGDHRRTFFVAAHSSCFVFDETT